jgi:hypothetical protein
MKEHLLDREYEDTLWLDWIVVQWKHIFGKMLTTNYVKWESSISRIKLYNGSRKPISNFSKLGMPQMI